MNAPPSVVSSFLTRMMMPWSHCCFTPPQRRADLLMEQEREMWERIFISLHSSYCADEDAWRQYCSDMQFDFTEAERHWAQAFKEARSAIERGDCM